ncbi:type I DNA topoisomerase [Verrucomicrobiota bacterium]
MGTKLVIVESPAKAKTINRILGSGYVVKSSVGHVRDLPEKSMGVDIKNAFKPTYVVVKGKKRIIDELKRDAKNAEAIYLAPDPDREGEAIAWHIKELLSRGNADKGFLRVQYNEVTAEAVRRAFDDPGEIDMQRVDAQQARRILDRIVGYMVSPVLWRRVRRGLSAGRVQSVALRLVCEREHEIRGFVPEAYWIMGAKVRKLLPPLDPFEIRLYRVDGEKAEVKTQEQADRIREDLDGRELVVDDISVKEVSKKAPPPFITSTLQQAGSSRLGLSPRRTMMIAQKLYEGVDLGDGPVGLITYMRTDSFTVSGQAVGACREFISRVYGEAFCPEQPNVFRNRAGAQAAHEAIRPTDVSRGPDAVAGKLDRTEMKLYRLIWERFVASQMAPARIEQRSVTILAPPPQGQPTLYAFRASASEVKFPGYMKVSGADAGKKEGDDSEVDRLPNLGQGERLQCLEWLSERRETKPPTRYSEASLVRALESEGVGRPSTYAQIIATLQQRKYASTEKRMLIPTELGLKVSELLVSLLGDLFDVKFTASMEDALDRVEKGDIQGTAMLQEFYTRFEGWMEGTKEPPADQDFTRRVITRLSEVGEWAPEVKSGKRTYSDRSFVESIEKQLNGGEKAVSQRQLMALVRIAHRYREQVSGLEALIDESGYKERMSASDLEPPRDSTLQKLEAMAALELDESTARFLGSLTARAGTGRRLSEAQLKALDRMVFAHSEEIVDFEKLSAGMAIEAPPAEETREAEALLGALSGVTEWREPTKRGKRVYDDASFYGSLKDHFAKRKYLSVRQKAALKRIIRRYHAQVPDYDRLAAELNIGKSDRSEAPKGEKEGAG